MRGMTVPDNINWCIWEKCGGPDNSSIWRPSTEFDMNLHQVIFFGTNFISKEKLKHFQEAHPKKASDPKMFFLIPNDP
jgi:hypothetical protein